jgi:recombination protein RecA
MQTDRLQRAIGAIHVRFGDQALVQASRLPAARPWPTGQPVVDRLSGIGGLPGGRVAVLQGPSGSGKLSMALALLARATREFARVVALDPLRAFDPWTLGQLDADLATLAVVRPSTPAATGEAAVALARAGAGFLLVQGTLPEAALAPLESAAARSGCLVLAVAEPGGEPGQAGSEAGAARALAYASSLTLQLERVGWRWERGQVVGLRSRVRCAKNRLAAPGAETELEVRYPLAPGRAPVGAGGKVPAREDGGGAGVERWWERSAAG